MQSQSIKLSESRRNEIAAKLLVGKFDKRRDALIEVAASLAHAVYAREFKKQLAAMEALPEGWLPTADSIRAKFSDAKDDFVELKFNGSYFHKPLLGCVPRKLDIVECRFPHSRRYSAVIVEAPFLISSWAKLQDMKYALENDHAALLREITSALSSASTTGALIRRWPEIEPLVAGMFPIERANLPAPLLHDLNKKLGLRGA